jgi:PA14 domain
MSKKVKRNAIHSGIGDNDDLFVKRPQKEDITEDFEYAARLRGKKRHDTLIYPEINFDYDVSYTGETLETFNEKEYEFNINGHPEKKIDYCITETKELPVKRLWEAQACFEAEVRRFNMEYAVEYKGHTGIKDKRTAEYAVDWKAQYNVRNLGDVKDYFTDSQGHFIGYPDGSSGWVKSGNKVQDVRNRSFFSGVVAKDMYNWNAYEASFSFKPILNDGAGIFGDTKRYNWSSKSFYNSGKWDDDIVGLIFQAQDKKNFYMMMWEADERIWMSGRSGNNLDGINITKNDGEFVNRQDVSPRNYPDPPTHSQWSNYVNNAGWGTKHYRIYKVTNGVMSRVNVTMHGAGKGWIMNNMHRIRLVTTGSNVKIYARTSATGSEFKMFDFNTDWSKGSFGMFNVSQSVEFHSIEVVERKIIQGRIPESGWDSSDAASKTIASNATTYVKNSDSFKGKLPSSISASSVTMMDIGGQIRNSANGSITVGGMTSSIVVKAKDYTTWKEYAGRIKPSGWFEFDGIGNYTHAPNAQEYVRQQTGINDLVIDSINGIVKDPKTGSVVISAKTGPIIAKNNNPPDAGKIYKKCYVRCGIVEVTPDNRDYNTGLLVFADIATVFKDDYNEFFNREDYINKKATYELLKPVKKDPPKPPPKEESEAGCVIEEEEPEVEEPIIECLNDFDFDGKKLVMWSCEFPIETTRKCFEDIVVAYWGWTTFDPLVNFNPNKWTVYKLEPVEGTVNPVYDEIKWAGRTDYDKAPVGTKVVIRTTEWYKAIFSADIVNKGIINSEITIESQIPPAPEHFWHPDATDDSDVTLRMPDHYEVVHFLVDAWDNHPDVQYSWKSAPNITTDVAKQRAANVATLGNRVVAAVGRTGMPILVTTNIVDTLLINCKPDPRYIPWSSGKYIGYGKVNGKRPFYGEKIVAGVPVSTSGKADMINVSTRVVFFPENLVMETLKGPFISIHDKEFPDYPRVKYKLHTDNTLVDFYSDHTDSHIWYSDWYSKWVESKTTYSAKMQSITEIENPLSLDPTDPNVSDDYNPDNTVIERIEVTSNNPFVKLWIEEDKGDHNGLLGTYYRFPLTSNIYEEHWNVTGDYKEWTQMYEIESYMDKVEIPIEHDGFTIIDVKIDGNLIPKNSTNGWQLSGSTVILKGTGIKAGNLQITYSTGGINNTFTLEKNLGEYIEVYVNGVLLDPVDYSFDQREMTIARSQLFLHDYVNIQSYEMNDLFDPTKREYLGERVNSQLDFQEDVPSVPTNPNYGDPYYEGSFCFNWGFQAPNQVEVAMMEAQAQEFKTMSMFLPETMAFKFNVDMEIVYPVGTPVDISNFTGEWKQWDQDPILAESGLDGPGDWHGPPEAGYPEVTNLRNQSLHSGWYNPAHKDLTDYDFRFKVSARKGDDDMYGAIFKFDPVTQNFYSFEWDAFHSIGSGGTGVKGMAIYKNTCRNPEDAGKARLSYTQTRLAHADISWEAGAAQVNEIKVSTIGNKIKVWTNDILRFDIADNTDPFLKGAWGPVTRSQPDTYFWDFWMQTYRRVTPTQRPAFRKEHEMTKPRPMITDDPMIELELDSTEMEDKFQSVLNAYCSEARVDKASIVSIEYYIRNDVSDYDVYFKEFQEIRVLELTPDNLAPNPMGRTSIQEAVRLHGSFDPSKTIKITQDKYSNWNKYKIEDYDVLTFTPADCNAQFDIVSDEMEDFVRKFKNAADKVLIFTHDTGVMGTTPRHIKLLKEFGFDLSTGIAYTAHNKITRVDNSFNYPYDLAGTVPITLSHWNQVNGTTPIYMFEGQDKAWLSYRDNVYYSEAGHSLYQCSGAFNQQLSDNEMKIWINLICRIAQWEAEAKPVMTKYGQSKLYTTVKGQYPPVGDPVEKPVPYPESPQIPELQPPTNPNPNDGFTVSWNGYIYAPESGVYKFKAMANDGFRLWVKNTEIISEWHITGNPNYFPEYEGSIYLEGGKWHPIRANYFDNVGQALVRLHWAMPNRGFQRISPDYLTPYLGYKLFAQVKQARPLPWHPLIHNGYYYHEEREHYLYAEKIVHKKTPNLFHEVTITPRPQQGSAIIVRDNQGNNLRKVTFYDENWNLTLENTESFHGNGYAKYYMNYKGIDKATLKVKVNGETLTNYSYIFNEDESSIEFMEKLHQADSIEVKYKLLYSYYLDMNNDIEDGFVANDVALIKLHSNYDSSKMKNMQIIYEAAKETPFYRATEVVFNPILNHNHTGFLYITEEEEQDVKDLLVSLSEKTLSNSGLEKVVLTAKVIDKYGNPCPNKLVKILRDGILISEDKITNDAGEVYLYDTPRPPSGLISTYQVQCEGILKEALLNYYIKDEAERYYLDTVVEKLSIMAGVNDISTIKVTLRDKNWSTAGAGKTVKVTYRDTYGQTRTETKSTDGYGQVSIPVSGLNEQHGNMMVTISYNMGFEDTANYVNLKVIGG